jgi:hypothetical protein
LIDARKQVTKVCHGNGITRTQTNAEETVAMIGKQNTNIGIVCNLHYANLVLLHSTIRDTIPSFLLHIRDNCLTIEAQKSLDD